MYVGTTDKRGFHHLLWEIVDNSVDEAMGGYADRISVTIHEDESVTVTDNGRGIPVSPQTSGSYKGMSTLEMVMTVLHAGGKFEGKGYQFSGGLHGVGVSVVNALSTRVQVQVRRDGQVHSMSFAGKTKKVRGKSETYVPGLVEHPLKVIGKTKSKSDTGTQVRFWPNLDVFSCDTWDSKLVLAHMRRSAFLNPGLTFAFSDERHEDEPVEFCYPNGLSDFMKEEAIERVADSEDAEPSDVVPSDPIVLGGKAEDGTGEWSLAMLWFPDERYITHSFANGVTTPNGGAHVRGFEDAMTGALNKFARQDHIALLGDKDENLKAPDWRSGCGMVLSAKVREPQFVGQTKEELSNPEIRAMVKSQFSVQFAQWLDSHPAEAKHLVERFVQQMKFRIKMSDIAKAEKSKGKQGFQAAKMPLPAKLTDCSNREGSELFIVEGDSAAGPAIKARNSSFQAVLPVRGKGLNIERALNGREAATRISENKEVQGIIATLGAGSQDMFDVSQMRYEKVIMLMDADADGAHIRLLLTTLFYRLMPRLVEEGRLYVARPPLFSTRKGDGKVYLANEAERDQFLADNPRHSEPFLRYKGLGESNSSELGEAVLWPHTRRVDRIVIEDAEAADETLRSLMGSDTSAKWDVLKDAVFDEEDVA
jgi:DNA gyrase subunit B